MNLFNIEYQYSIMEKRGWDKLYWAVDIHDTILYADYNNNEPLRFAPYAKEVLQYLTNSNKAYLILYTCSYEDEIQRYLDFFKFHNIIFDDVNENNDVKNNLLGCFDKKLYFNILLENKAGFDMENDWLEIYKLLNKIENEN